MKKIIRKCAFCNKEFYSTPSKIKRGRGINCSKICQSKSNIGKKCSIETKEKLRVTSSQKRHTEETRKKMSKYAKKHSFGKWMKGRTPAFITQGKHFSHPKGEKHPYWKGGISPWNFEIRHSEKYKQWRKDVFIRDHFTCQQCGHRFLNIIAHHIKSFADYKDLWFSVNNGKTLCRSCHCKLHNPKKDKTR